MSITPQQKESRTQQRLRSNLKPQYDFIVCDEGSPDEWPLSDELDRLTSRLLLQSSDWPTTGIKGIDWRILLDEMGYVPLADIGAEFLFQVNQIVKRT
ncbi:MAG: hypothetical protein WBV55_18400 [Candidatus Sulfotelmatobacter sp.]